MVGTATKWNLICQLQKLIYIHPTCNHLPTPYLMLDQATQHQHNPHTTPNPPLLLYATTAWQGATHTPSTTLTTFLPNRWWYTTSLGFYYCEQWLLPNDNTWSEVSSFEFSIRALDKLSHYDGLCLTVVCWFPSLHNQTPTSLLHPFHALPPFVCNRKVLHKSVWWSSILLLLVYTSWGFHSCTLTLKIYNSWHIRSAHHVGLELAFCFLEKLELYYQMGTWLLDGLHNVAESWPTGSVLVTCTLATIFYPQ